MSVDDYAIFRKKKIKVEDRKLMINKLYDLSN